MNKKEKFTESHVIYSRILWDDALDKQHFWIGFIDRISASGIREKHLLDWNPDGDIPWHRVVYIRCKEVTVWDRKNRIDLFKDQKLPEFAWKQADNPFNTQIILQGDTQLSFEHRPCIGFVQNEWQEIPTLPPTLDVEKLVLLSWNVLKDTHNPELTYSNMRFPAIIKEIASSKADIIALQEVTRGFYQELLKQDWAKKYFISDLPISDVFEEDTIIILSKFPFIVTEHLFSKHKRLLVAHFQTANTPFYVATVHLTSDMSNNSTQKRAQQMQVFFDWFNTVQGDALILGDFNADVDEQTKLLAGKGFIDAWTDKDGYTYNPEVNPLANILSPTKRVRRLDALHLKSQQWQIKQAELFATKPFAELAGKPFFCSDHFGLLVDIERNTSQILPNYFAQAQPTYHSALVWIPPQIENIQEIRALHDSKYERWLPHITLIYGFISEALFEEAAVLIAEAVADLQSFEIELQSVQFFEHRQSFTAWLQPDTKAIHQLQILQARLQKLFPTCDEQSNKPNGFTPHLSLGQFDSLENLQKIIPLWKPLKTQVSEIVLQSREKDTPFTIRYKVVLGQKKFTKVTPTWQMPIEIFMPPLTLQDKQNREIVLEIIQQACLDAIPQTVQVEQMGSAYLGIVTPQSDIDIVCIIPKDVERVFFLSKLQDILSLFATSVRLVEDAQVPILKLVINGVAIDILVAQSPILPVVFSLPALLRQQSNFDTLSWQILSGILEATYILKTIQEVISIEQFRLYVRVVRAWAKARGLVGNGWGYLGSYSWTILVANALLAYLKHEKPLSLENFMTFFFKMYAQHDWKEVVALTQVGKAYKASTKRDKMPIITNIEPCFNSARNVTKSTFKRIKAELNRAHSITKKPANESSWESLLDKIEIINKPNHIYFEIRIKTDDLPILTQSVGWLEGNIISLFVELEQDESLTLEFLPTVEYHEFQALFKVWIVAEHPDLQLINSILQNFANKFNIPQAKLSIDLHKNFAS